MDPSPGTAAGGPSPSIITGPGKASPSLVTKGSQPPKKRKTGLKKSYYSRKHFSSPYNEKADGGGGTRLVVRLIAGRNLLASDVETGKSDPLALVWCCATEELEEWVEALEAKDRQRARAAMAAGTPAAAGSPPSSAGVVQDPAPSSAPVEVAQAEASSRIQKTKVCYTTCDPRWDAELIFPLHIATLEDVLAGYLKIVIRDEDTGEDGSITYDELGFVIIPFTELFRLGTFKRNAISVVSKWFTLRKAPGMHKVSGEVRLSLFLTVSDEDLVRAGGPEAAAGTEDPLHELRQRVLGYQQQQQQQQPSPSNGGAWSSPDSSPNRRRSWDHRQSMVAPPLCLRSCYASPVTGTGSPVGFPLDDVMEEADEDGEVDAYEDHEVLLLGPPSARLVRESLEGTLLGATHQQPMAPALAGTVELMVPPNETPAPSQHQQQPGALPTGSVAAASQGHSVVAPSLPYPATQPTAVEGPMPSLAPLEIPFADGGDESAPPPPPLPTDDRGSLPAAQASNKRSDTSSKAAVATVPAVTATSPQPVPAHVEATVPPAPTIKDGASQPPVTMQGGLRTPQAPQQPAATATQQAPHQLPTQPGPPQPLQPVPQPTQQQPPPLQQPPPQQPPPQQALPQQLQPQQPPPQQQLPPLQAPLQQAPPQPQQPPALQQLPPQQQQVPQQVQLPEQQLPHPQLTQQPEQQPRPQQQALPGLPLQQLQGQEQLLTPQQQPVQQQQPPQQLPQPVQPSPPQPQAQSQAPQYYQPQLPVTMQRHQAPLHPAPPAQLPQQQMAVPVPPPPTTSRVLEQRRPSTTGAVTSMAQGQMPQQQHRQLQQPQQQSAPHTAAGTVLPPLSGTGQLRPRTTGSLTAAVGAAFGDPSSLDGLAAPGSYSSAMNPSFLTTGGGVAVAAPPSSSSSHQTHGTYTSKLLRMQQTAKTSIFTHAVGKFKKTATASSTQRRRSSAASTSTTLSTTIAVNPTWRARLLASLARLEHRETHNRAYLELREMAVGLLPEQVLVYLNAMRKMTNAKPLATRASLLRLFAVLALDYPTVVLRGGVESIVAFLVERIHDPETALRDACVECTSSIALHLLPLCLAETDPSSDGTSADVDIMRVFGPLLSVMSEQSLSSQEGAGLCIAALAGPFPPPLTLMIQTDAKLLQDAREMLRRSGGNEATSPELPRESLLLPDGMLLLDFPTVAEARRFWISLSSTSSSLPAQWKLLDFPEDKAQRLNSTWTRYVRCLGRFCPRLLHSVLSVMKQRNTVRGPLFHAIRNLAAMASTQPEGGVIAKALAVAVAPAAERAMAVLKEKDKDRWRERITAADMVVALSQCYDCIPALLEIKPAMLSALLANRFDQIRQIREAVITAMASLNELNVSQGPVMAAGPLGGEVEADSLDAIAAVTGGRGGPSIQHPQQPLAAVVEGDGQAGEGDMALPSESADQLQQVSKMKAAAVASKTGVAEAAAATMRAVDSDAALAPGETTRLAMTSTARGLMAAKGGASPVAAEQVTVAGNGAQTARVLKDLAKSMNRGTATLQRTVERLSSDLIDRLTQLERSLERSNSPVRRASSATALNPTGAAPSDLTAVDGVAEKDNTSSGSSSQVAAAVNALAGTKTLTRGRSLDGVKEQPKEQQQQRRGSSGGVVIPVDMSSSKRPQQGVSLWRETCWLVHCGEVEAAYERVLIDGSDRDLARLMKKTGVCLSLLSAQTKGLLFSQMPRMFYNDAYLEVALPWVIKATQTGDALDLPRSVRKELVKGLYHVLSPGEATAWQPDGAKLMQQQQQPSLSRRSLTPEQQPQLPVLQTQQPDQLPPARRPSQPMVAAPLQQQQTPSQQESSPPARRSSHAPLQPQPPPAQQEASVPPTVPPATRRRSSGSVGNVGSGGAGADAATHDEARSSEDASKPQAPVQPKAA